MSRAEAAARRTAQEAARRARRTSGDPVGGKVWYVVACGSLVRLAGPDAAGAAKRAGLETTWARRLS